MHSAGLHHLRDRDHPRSIMAFVHLLCTFLLLLTSTSSQSTTPSFTTISDTFQSLVTQSLAPKNEYVQLISEIGQYATNKSSDMTQWQNDEKKVLNQMTAALTAKVLSTVVHTWEEFKQDTSQVREKITSLEQDEVSLAEYISTEGFQLATEIEGNMDSTFIFMNQLIALKSELSVTSNSTPPNLRDILQLPSLTVNLLQIYVCLEQQRFREVRDTVQISDALLFSEPPEDNPSIDFLTEGACAQAVSEVSSQLSSSTIAQLIDNHPEETRTLRLHYSNFQNFRTSPPPNTNQLGAFITTASNLESELINFVSNLEDPISSEDIQRHIELRRRLYSAIALSIQQAINISARKSESEESLDQHLVRDTLHEIGNSRALCKSEASRDLNPENFNKLLSHLTYYRYFKQLSDLISNLNTAQASRVQVSDPTLKILATLSHQVIKSSLLRIEYHKLLQNPDSPIHSKNDNLRVKNYVFTITQSDSCSPDNYIQSCYLINNQYPGPPIIVNQHDLLRVTVTNRLSVPTTIHFHGILQKFTLESDGVAHVTQDRIKPNETYVYEMLIGHQSGTFMYHGHMGLDLVWIHGSLIIHENPEEWKALGRRYKYDLEHVLMLEEIFHKSLDHLITDMREEGIDDPPVDSFAINGHSFGHWDANQGTAPGYQVLTVQPGKTYRFRVINMAAGSMLLVTLDNHTMTVIEADGIITQPVVTDRLEIHTGQRYSVLVKMTQPPGNYWVRARLMGDEGGADNGRLIIHYPCAEEVGAMKIQVFTEPSEPFPISGENWIYNQLMPNVHFRQKGVYPFPSRSSRQILVDMQMRTKEGPPRFLINGNLWRKTNVSYLERVRAGDNLMWDPTVFAVKEGEVIDLVFQNRVDDTGGCDEHPIHMHGHTFWVVTRGADEVNMSTIATQLSEERGNRRQFRDTFTLFPNSTVEREDVGAPCGWAVIRFLADNPGLWFVHCHVTSHMILGKAFVLYEYNERNPMLINE